MHKKFQAMLMMAGMALMLLRRERNWNARYCHNHCDGERTACVAPGLGHHHLVDTQRDVRHAAQLSGK